MSTLDERHVTLLGSMTITELRARSALDLYDHAVFLDEIRRRGLSPGYARAAYAVSRGESSAVGEVYASESALMDVADRELRVVLRAALERMGVDCARVLGVASAPVTRAEPSIDLAALVAAYGAQRDISRAKGCLFHGRLRLDTSVQPARGALAAAEAARASGYRAIVVSPQDAREAAIVAGIEVLSVQTALHLVAWLKGEAELDAPPAPIRELTYNTPHADLKDVRGNARAKRAMEIAAAGGYPLTLVGSPCTGKTTLARRVTGILPRLTLDEALAVTRIHSAAGLNIGEGLITERPFRAPHHSTSPAGLIGGGVSTRPGEAAQAHNGVLFLDELHEFSRASLELLYAAMRGGMVHLQRAEGAPAVYSTDCLVVASMTPCPCGYYGAHDKTRMCHCSPENIAIHCERAVRNAPWLSSSIVARCSSSIHETTEEPESSATVAQRVEHARVAAAKRAKFPVSQYSPVLPSTVRYAECTIAEQRARVAQTIADLAGEAMHSGHTDEAGTLVGFASVEIKR